MAYQVGTKGQVVIAKKLRDQLGIKPGWLATQVVVDDHVEIYFAPPRHRRSLKGSLREYAARAADHVDQDWSEVRAAAWTSAARDRRFPSAGVTVAADLGTP
jgi:bifunctional DNA-binding transcriptional regulator/antitoxin component of YhaV-PrlF toxin-antitoxin module